MIVGAATVIVAAAFTLLMSERARTPVVPEVVTPAPSAIVVPPPVKTYADRVVPSFDGIVRMDRKVVVRVGDVTGTDAMPGVTAGTWAIAVAGDIAQTWGVMVRPNSQCAVWFVNSLGEPLAFQSSALSICAPYFAAAK